MAEIRKFALTVIDDFDNEIDRFPLDYVETPKNLGFELEFTTLESQLTTYFTSAREKKLSTALSLIFTPPNAYRKVNAFKQFVQRYTNSRIVFEYNDTTGEIKNWEGKVQKLGQEELTEWEGLVCPLTFLPGTPKYIRKDNTIGISLANKGKQYPYTYPYAYGTVKVENNEIHNTYFDEIPLRIYVYGDIINPVLSLYDSETSEVYSTVRFKDLALTKDEHIILDSIQFKVWLWRDGKYISGYDYIDKSEQYDSFLFARENALSKLTVNLSSSASSVRASYRQYTL